VAAAKGSPIEDDAPTKRYSINELLEISPVSLKSMNFEIVDKYGSTSSQGNVMSL